VNENQKNVDFSEFIAENFGANATYVEGLLNRFRSDPALVDESWRAYFAEMLSDPAAVSVGSGNGASGRGGAVSFSGDSVTAATSAATSTGAAAGAKIAPSASSSTQASAATQPVAAAVASCCGE
jgi:2-oxoglutarate dehydrogenase complex dehydrogenase (E1) component-like enzyme